MEAALPPGQLPSERFSVPSGRLEAEPPAVRSQAEPGNETNINFGLKPNYKLRFSVGSGRLEAEPPAVRSQAEPEIETILSLFSSLGVLPCG
jgi:hypothetical protein